MEPTLVTGEGVGEHFVASTAEELTDALGFRPFPGTLNLTGAGVRPYPERTIDEVGDDTCVGVRLRDCRVAGVRAAIIRPFVPDYPPEKTEVLAPVGLRALFDLDEGDRVPLGSPDDVWPPTKRVPVPTELDAFEAVVFDLDGTLVDLSVDWSAARTEISTAIGQQLDRRVSEYDSSELFETARKRDVYDDLVSILSAHEHEGANAATPLPLVDVLEELSCPIGICTANSPEAAERALEKFDVRDTVDVIIGRDSVPEHKPSPEPLLASIDALGARPGNVVFIGDIQSDATTAKRAGTSFLASDQLSTTGPLE